MLDGVIKIIEDDITDLCSKSEEFQKRYDTWFEKEYSDSEEAQEQNLKYAEEGETIHIKLNYAKSLLERIKNITKK